jgi:hypothetical protein
VPETIQEQILQDLDAAILSIDADATGSTYFNTIGANQYVRADSAVVEAENGPFPFVVLAAMESKPEGDSFAGAETYIMKRLDFELHGHIQTQTNVQRDLARLEYDLWTAIWEDPTRGGLATRTWFDGVEYFYPLTTEGYAQIVMHCFVIFENKLSDLTSTIP